MLSVPSKRFEMAIVDKVDVVGEGIDHKAPLEMDIAKLSAYADLTISCAIDCNHDAIESAFSRKVGLFETREIHEFGKPGRFSQLFEHIAAEKARCAREAYEKIMSIAHVPHAHSDDLGMGEENPGRLAD